MKLFKLTVNLLFIIVISACQESAPTKPIWTNNDFSERLKQAEIPFESIASLNGYVLVNMKYGVESNFTDTPRYNSDVVKITEIMCNYNYGLGLKIEYSDRVSTIVNQETIHAYCDNSITADEVLSTYNQPTKIAP